MGVSACVAEHRNPVIFFMPDFLHALQSGAANLWLFIPTAILLGALHGLEPGHSKTMMAAFIIAVRGTITQAILLGLSAAISHSLIIWLLAAAALKFGPQWNAESTEPYFQIASGLMIAALGAWMFWRTRREQRAAADLGISLSTLKRRVQSGQLTTLPAE